MTQTSSHVVSLIGRGIGKSRSPWIHETEASALALQLTYRLVDFEAMGRADNELDEVVQTLVGAGYSGSNVTFPFKQAILPLCDKLSEAAAVLGAVNTLAFRDDQIVGENTDWIGFSWLIEREIGSISGASVAQIGAGGAGSATAYALAKLGAGEIALFDPQSGKAEALAARLEPHFPACHFVTCDNAESAIEGRDGVVNATPVGMSGLPGLPFPPSYMASRQWLADIIYFPLETELLAAARRNGQTAANGVSMVIGQAAEAFHFITGHKPDRDRMMNSLLAAIASEQEEKDAA